MADQISEPASAYALEHTTPLADDLAAVAGWTLQETPTPQMMSGLAEARLLQVLIVAAGAKRVLEIGTFTGFGAMAMAAALPAGGKVTTIEVDPATAETARRHIEASPYAGRIELIVEDALRALERLDGPFDLVYVDAWKSDYPAYYEAVVPKLAERGVIVADNLFRDGRALEPDVSDESTLGIREFARRVHTDERVTNVLLTVGDGLMVAWRA